MTKKKKIIISIISAVLAVVLVTTAIIICCRIAKDRKEDEEWANAVKAYREAKMVTYRSENEQYADYEVDIAFLGDSLTDGYAVKDYYPQYTVVNRGIGGDTTFDLEGRIQVSAYDLKPKVAVMLIGANNFSTMFDNYERIVSGLKTNLPNTKLVLLSLTAMSGEHWGSHNEHACFNNVKIKKIADKYDCTFVDLYTPLFDYDTNGILAEYTTDGGHLTASGYSLITGILTPVLDEILQNYSN